MLGSSKTVNRDQIADCLRRSWIVVVPNHRLCPQVNLLEGPMRDCRDLLAWIYEGGLPEVVDCQVDLDHVFAFGTSSGGTLALSLVSSKLSPFSPEDLTNPGLQRPPPRNSHPRLLRPLPLHPPLLEIPPLLHIRPPPRHPIPILPLPSLLLVPRAHHRRHIARRPTPRPARLHRPPPSLCLYANRQRHRAGCDLPVGRVGCRGSGAKRKSRVPADVYRARGGGRDGSAGVE